MDQLDKLKGAWKSQDYTEHKVSTADIYKMLHAKSSSYVKWIFYISIIEFVAMNSLILFRDVKKDMEFYEEIGLQTTFTIISIISYIVIFYFMYLFYRNYKKIKVDETAKGLMSNIINTRKTVKQYIYFNIIMGIVTTAIMLSVIFSNERNIELYKEMSHIPSEMSSTVLLIAVIIIMIIFLSLFLLFYRLIYGILLRRLKKNYKELEQLDK